MAASPVEVDPVAVVLESHRNTPGALLPILHEIQDALGYIPREAAVRVAEALNLSRAEVHGVITYYHDFRSEPPARHVVQVCRAEACQSVGADSLIGQVRERLGCANQDRSADGRFSVEPVYCLGLCASGPSLMIDKRLHARMTQEKFERLASRMEKES
jgi:formate dehydrogenase subunit gamma